MRHGGHAFALEWNGYFGDFASLTRSGESQAGFVLKRAGQHQRSNLQVKKLKFIEGSSLECFFY